MIYDSTTVRELCVELVAAALFTGRQGTDFYADALQDWYCIDPVPLPPHMKYGNASNRRAMLRCEAELFIEAFNAASTPQVPGPVDG